MSTICTVSDVRQYLDQVPAGVEQDAILQAVLDRAERTILRQLIGVTIEDPAPDDLKQIVLELTSALWLTKGTATRLETIGRDGQGGFEYAGGLTPEQKAALRQIRIEAGEIAI